MLGWKFRLPSQSQIFKRVNRFIQSKSTKYFKIKTISNKLPISRFGVAVVKQYSNRGAVQRNRIRRIVFGFIQERGIYQNPGRDTLIIVFPAVNKLTNAEIKKELNDLLINNWLPTINNKRSFYGYLISRNTLPAAF